MESFTRRVTENNMRGNTQDRTPRRVMVSILLTVYIMSSGVLVAAARSSTCRVAPSPIISRVGGVHFAVLSTHYQVLGCDDPHPGPCQLRTFSSFTIHFPIYFARSWHQGYPRESSPLEAHVGICMRIPADFSNSRIGMVCATDILQI